MRKLFELAHKSLGIYPASTIMDNVTTKRTPYQDGWNKAILECNKRWLDLETWRSNLREKERESFDYLLALEDSRLSADFDDKNAISLYFVMNDVFIPAAVEESVTPSDLVVLAEIHLLYGDDGICAFFADRYDCPPRRGMVNEDNYKNAIVLLNTYLKHPSLRA